MKKRFRVLDIFRGLFASFVYLFHLTVFAETPFLRNGFTYNSDMFVDFFFVLSGFVIANSYERMDSMAQFKTFYKKRFLRIYPLHLIVLIAFVGMELAKQLMAGHIQVNNLHNPANSGLSFLSNLLLLQSTPVFGIKDVSWNIASWSISAEMIAYLVFGMLVVMVHKMGWFRQRVIMYLLVVLVSAALLVMITGGYALNYSFDVGFLRGLIGFFAGVLCLLGYRHTAGRMDVLSGGLFTVLELFTIVLTFYCIARGDVFKEFGLMYVLLFMVCIYVFSFEKGILSALLNKIPVLHELGAYSYSIYMWHTLLISLFNVLFIRVLHLPASSYVWLVFVNFLAIFFVAKWSYKHIEMRFTQR